MLFQPSGTNHSMSAASIRWPAVFAVRRDGSARYVFLVAWCAILLGCVFRLTQLPTRVLFLDEAITQIRVSGHTGAEMMQTLYDGRQRTAHILREDSTVDANSSARRLIGSLEQEDAQHPPLFYLAELGFVRAFGNSLLAWRLLPAFFGILALPAAYALARELFYDTRAGLLAAALFAASPIQRIYSDQAREYSLLILLVLLATTAVVRASRTQTLGSWSLYALLTAAGLYANPFMSYVIAAHGVYVIASTQNRRRTLFAFAGATAAALVAYSPWILEVFLHRSEITATNLWSATTWPFARLAAKWAFNTGAAFFDLEYVDIRWDTALILVAVLAMVAIVRAFRSAGPEARWCLGAAIFVPAILLAAPDILLGEHRSSVARYGLPIFAMLPIVAARGLVGRPIMATLILGISLFSSAVGLFHASWWDNDANADDTQIAAIINREPRAQLISSVPPFALATIARLLGENVRVSLGSPITANSFSPADPIFVLRPTLRDLQTLKQSTGLAFVPVAYARAVTAHEMGARIASTDGSGGAMSDLYRAVR
jgi:uncharacterized membrane protein